MILIFVDDFTCNLGINSKILLIKMKSYFHWVFWNGSCFDISCPQAAHLWCVFAFFLRKIQSRLFVPSCKSVEVARVSTGLKLLACHPSRTGLRPKKCTRCHWCWLKRLALTLPIFLRKLVTGDYRFGSVGLICSFLHCIYRVLIIKTTWRAVPTI